MTAPTAIVIGAGISGLAAAFELRRAGEEPLLLEASPNTGGVIQAERVEGYLLELGPNTVRATSPLIALCDAVGLGDRILAANPEARRRYVRRGGRLNPLPAGPGGLLKSSLWSLRGKLSLLAEPVRPRRASGRETVTDFFVRRVGRELFDYAVEPFVGGTFAGDPDRLEMCSAFRRLAAWESAHGSLLRGALWSRRREVAPRIRGVVSFAGGLSELTDQLASSLGAGVCRECAVTGVHPDGDGWVVEAGPRRWSAPRVVLATGSRQAAGLIGAWAPAASAALERVESAGIATVHLGFSPADRGLDGFGFLNPRCEGRAVLGALCASNCFPDRAPEGHQLVTVYIGGDRQPELLCEDDDRLGALALEELASVGLAGGVVLRITRYVSAIPQYRPGHAALEASLGRLEAEWPGLGMVGAYRGGVSVSDCVANARAQAERLVGIPGAD